MQPKTAESDAMSDSTASSTTSAVIPVRPSPADQLPPGTARVRATVTDCVEDAGRFVCAVTIREVKGYGSATAPLAPATQMQAYFPKATMPTDLETRLGPDADLEVLIQRNQMMGSTREAATWTVLRLY